MTGTLLTTLEVAERLGLSSAAVAQAVRTGALLPTARTNEDFLFTERAVAAFAESRAEAAATPLEPPPAVSRGEWSGDVDRLNSWLKDLSESVSTPAQPAQPAQPARPAQPTQRAQPAVPAAAPLAHVPAPLPAPIATPEEARPAIDFRPPPHPLAEQPAAAPSQPQAQPAAEQVPTPFHHPEPMPVPAAQPPPPPPVRPAAQVLAETPPKPDPVPDAVARPAVATRAEPEPTPVAAAEPVAVEKPHLPTRVVAAEPVAMEEPHLPTPAEATAPLPEAVAALKSGLSRQAVLVVEPIERFRILRDIADRLATIPGVDDARLERLEGGLASYRLSFGSNRPSGEAIAGALAPLGLQVMLVDAQ